MRKKKINIWGLLVVGVIVISVVVTLIHRGNPLPDYRGSAGEEPSSEPSGAVVSSEPVVQVVPYTNETPQFTVNVPADWTKVIKNGYVTWVDKVSASSLQIQIGESDPAILEVTRDSVATELAAVGAELVQFYWMDEWDFACMYRTFQEAGSIANIEITAFNQQHIIRFVFVINETYYTKLESTVAQVVDSFVWDRFA